MKALETLFRVIENEPKAIAAWFDRQWQGLQPLPYFSCDVRHAQYKMGVVDTNLFSAGFNNLCHTFSDQVTQAFDDYFTAYYPQARTIAILAENHTRNKFYLLNVLHLQNLIAKTGRQALVTMILPDYPKPEVAIALLPDRTLTLHAPQIESQNLFLQNQKIDLILSNNDFSSGLPGDWQTLNAPLIPPLNLGWQTRTKSRHFDILQNLTTDLAQHFDFDAWQIMPLHRVVQNVSLDNMQDLAQTADALLAQIKAKYDEYGISETPYCFVKNNSGTYGLGLITAQSGSEILQLNRKARQSLFAKKGDSQNSEFLLQEGIPTHDSYSHYPIEPVIYGVGKKSVAGFFRFHEGRDAYQSLNSPGMGFSCLCLHKLDEPHEAEFIDCCSKRDLVRGSMFLADLAALAAAKEQKSL